jgi:predicted dinucleotide-binding enzyme
MSAEAEKLEALKTKLGTSGASAEVETILCSTEACWEADIIIIATPHEAAAEIADKIRAVATGKIVISVSNPMNSQYAVQVESGTSVAEELQKLLPDSKVVKTFNTAFVTDINNPLLNGKALDAYIAGNNGDAVEAVSSMIKTAGFNPIVAGRSLAEPNARTYAIDTHPANGKNSYNGLTH